MTLLLLPFTQTLDMRAANATCILAQQTNATLVARSLTPYISSQDTREKQAEHLLHYKEFMEAVQQTEAHYVIPVERIELSTHNSVNSIMSLLKNLSVRGLCSFSVMEKGAY